MWEREEILKTLGSLGGERDKVPLPMGMRPNFENTTRPWEEGLRALIYKNM